MNTDILFTFQASDGMKLYQTGNTVIQQNGSAFYQIFVWNQQSGEFEFSYNMSCLVLDRAIKRQKAFKTVGKLV